MQPSETHVVNPSKQPVDPPVNNGDRSKLEHAYLFCNKSISNIILVADGAIGIGEGELTGQPAQVQSLPQWQEPVEAHPQPDMLIVGGVVCSDLKVDLFALNVDRSR